MKRWALAALFGIGFAAALAGTVPMRLALSWLGADRIGVAATEVSGSLWNGRLTAAQYRGIALGDVEASLDPFALVAGTRRLTVHGTLGSATLVQGGTRGFEAADGAIEVAHLHTTLPLAGLMRLEQATLLFSERPLRARGRAYRHGYSQARIRGTRGRGHSVVRRRGRCRAPGGTAAGCRGEHRPALGRKRPLSGRDPYCQRQPYGPRRSLTRGICRERRRLRPFG